MTDASQAPDPDRERYRLLVGGIVDAAWRDWFGAEVVRSSGDRTILEVRVADQAELFGRLRRIHDLNLRLIAVTRLDPDAGTGDR